MKPGKWTFESFLGLVGLVAGAGLLIYGLATGEVLACIFFGLVAVVYFATAGEWRRRK